MLSVIHVLLVPKNPGIVAEFQFSAFFFIIMGSDMLSHSTLFKYVRQHGKRRQNWERHSEKHLKKWGMICFSNFKFVDFCQL